MEDTKELAPKQERIIQLNQEFQPDFHEHILKPGRIFSTEIALEIGDLKIPIRIETMRTRMTKDRAIAPFNPELGYIITEDDFDPQKRNAKNEPLRGEYMDFPETPFALEIESSPFTLNERGLNKKHEVVLFEFPQKILNLMKRLRVQVTAGEGRYEARTWETGLRLGGLQFNYFYPLETGSLPSDPDEIVTDQSTGLGLALPDDPEKLSTIKMKFVLADEERIAGEQQIEQQRKPSRRII